MIKSSAVADSLLEYLPKESNNIFSYNPHCMQNAFNPSLVILTSPAPETPIFTITLHQLTGHWRHSTGTEPLWFLS